MTPRPRPRFWLEAATSVLAAVLAVLTLTWPEWIEGRSGWDPDHGDGSVEWLLAGGLAVLAVAVSLAAGREWRRPRPATA
jgi:hypothetical protein